MKPEIVSLREFKLKGIRCVSVRDLDDHLLGFYIGVEEDWVDGVITKSDLLSVTQLKKEINRNGE